jgi:hypothetical protein
VTDVRRNDLLAVLLDALERFYTHVSDRDPDGRATFRETERWFSSTEASDPTSFEFVCSRLGLEPGRIRQSLVKRRAEILGEVLRITPRSR